VASFTLGPSERMTCEGSRNTREVAGAGCARRGVRYHARMIGTATQLGAYVVAVLGVWLAWTEPRTAPHRGLKIGMAVLAILVAVGAAYVGHVQARDLAFAKYGAAVTLHATGGGL
jgi:hypothetical protein